MAETGSSSSLYYVTGKSMGSHPVTTVVHDNSVGKEGHHNEEMDLTVEAGRILKVDFQRFLLIEGIFCNSCG